MSGVVQRCGDGPCDCAHPTEEEPGAAGPADTAQRRVDLGSPDVQRNVLGDAWDAVTSAGPAAAQAAQLVARVVANPSMLPMVMGAIAWEQLPDSLKGPLIDQVLSACLAAARTVSIPGPPGLPIGTILQHVAIGALERALTYPTGMKVRVANRMAQVVLNPSADFSFGFLKGLVSGLWDGLTGPFVLLWDLAKIGYEIQAAEMRFLSTLAHQESRARLGRDVQAALAVIEPRVAAAVSELMGGRGDPRQILRLIDQLVNSALRGVESLGASLSDALLRFFNRPDEGLGEGVGYVAGTATFEVLLLVLTEGGYTAIKEAVQGLRVVIRLAEAGAQAAEALGPVLAALAGFRNFARGNRALGPLVEALEAAFNLLVRFLRMSYGLEGAGSAARAGERGVVGTGERAASREIRVADTAMQETHEITMLADGRLIRCSDRCLELVASINERAQLLAAERMPGESARLISEAEEIATQARGLQANTALSEAERATQEAALMRRAGSLERQTAAAEREALNRMAAPATRRTDACRGLLTANADAPALRGFDGRLSELEREIAKTRELATDPEMRQLAREELASLEQQANELEGDIRRLVPEGGQAAAGGRRYAPSPKHAEGGFGTLMDLDDATAQRVLTDGITGPNGRQVYGFHDGKIYEFQPDNVGGFHGYPVPGTEVPNSVLRQWRDSGVITAAQYRRFVRGA